MTKNMSAADYRAEAANMLSRARELEALEAEHQRLLEPDYDEAVIMWRHRFPSSRQTYTFIAFKHFGRWYRTGVAFRERGIAPSFTWDQLIEQFPAIRDGNFWVVSEWVPVGDPDSV